MNTIMIPFWNSSHCEWKEVHIANRRRRDGTDLTHQGENIHGAVNVGVVSKQLVIGAN
jgi:hypothetical protein